MDMNEEYGLTPYETREILFYKTDNGEVRVEILLYQENLWQTASGTIQAITIWMLLLLSDTVLILKRLRCSARAYSQVGCFNRQKLLERRRYFT